MPKEKLTAQFVMLAYCPEGRNKIEYYDTNVTGLTLEVRPSGGRTFWLRFRDGYGKQKQYRIGNAADLSVDKARKEAQRLRGQIALGHDPAQARVAKKAIITVAELGAIYLDYARGRKRSHDIDERYVRNHIIPQFGKLRLDQVRQNDVTAWLASKVDKDGYAKATVNRCQVILSCMFKLAKRSKMPGADQNPLEGVPLLNPDNERERYLSREEVQRLKMAVEASENPQLKNIVGLLLLTGARKRELLDAKWEDFDLPRNAWRVPTTKAGKPRSVPLSDDALKIINQLPRWDGCPFLLPNPMTMKPFITVFNAWDTARRRAGLGDVRLHDLRHQAASNMANSGQSLYAVGKVLGHSQPRTTQRYAHLSNDTLVAAANAGAAVAGW